MSAQHYYVIIDNDPDNRQTFENVESLRNFFLNYPNRTELFHPNADLSGIKIRYYITTGEVELVPKEENSVVYNFFTGAYKAIAVEDVKEAICQLAKYQLLQELSALNDREINSIIKRNQLQFDGQPAKPANNLLVDNTLREIQKLAMPREKENSLSIGMIGFFKVNQDTKMGQSQVLRAIHSIFEEKGINKNKQSINNINAMNVVTEIMTSIKMNMSMTKEQSLQRKVPI
jgi:hypothetical protein